MGDPIQNLSQINLQNHPALEEFLLRIYADRHELPPLSEIIVTNDSPNDGIVDVSYVDEPRSRIYAARLNAAYVDPRNEAAGPQNAVSYNFGRLDARGRPTWDHRVAPTEIVPLTCGTVHALGGNLEDRFSCADLPLSTIFDTQRNTQLMAAGGWWASFELGGRFMRRGSFTRALLGGLRPVGTSAFTPSQRLWHTGPGVAVGMGAMLLSNPLANALNLDPSFHRNERWALAVGMGHGGNLLTNYFQARGIESNTVMLQRLIGRGDAYRSAVANELVTETRIVARPTIRPMGFASGLLSSALVDATLGRYFEEGSPERFALRSTGFFLPQIFRSFIGERALAIGERRGVAGFTRWGGRAVTALFAADMLYMGANYLSDGSVGSGRRNNLYAHANEIQRRHQHPVVAFFDGLAETIAPSLAQRLLVGDEYVDVARREFESSSNATSARASSALRQFLLFNPLGNDRDPEFYRHVDLSLFRGSNILTDGVRADGHRLAVRDVYAQISDPTIYETRIAGRPPAEQIRYIQEQFRGHRLSEGDVREILGRIAIHRLREEIAQLHFIDTPEHQPLLRLFDSHGSLRAGRESELLAHIFPEIDQGESQILALRRVGLVNHIRQLEANGRSAEAAPYIAVATDLGLRNASGTWASTGEASEIVTHGLALANAHPMTLPAPRSPGRTPTSAELIRYLTPRLGRHDG